LGEWLQAEEGIDRAIKLIALYDVLGVPDCAAELILALKETTPRHTDWDYMLDLLVPTEESYKEYVERFRSDRKTFMPRD
jgi:hypothetical protein